MKRNPVFLLVSILVVFAGPSFSQSTASTAVVPSVTFDIADQPDSPLAVSLDNRVVTGMPGAPLKVVNNSSSAVVAFVLHIKAVPKDQSHMTILGNGLGPAATHTQAVFIPTAAKDSDRPIVSVDYVQFEDGRSWGDDALGRSKNVRAYLDGRTLALSRLKDLLAGQDDSDFMKAIAAFRSAGFGEPVFPAGQNAARNVDYTARGYEEVLNTLRRMPKRSDEAKELARKLELMPMQ